MTREPDGPASPRDEPPLGTSRDCEQRCLARRRSARGRPVASFASIPVVLLGFAALLAVGGCAAGLSPAERLVRRGDFREAAEAYRLQESDNLYDPALKRTLAACWLRSGEADRALVKLGEALALEPMDPLTWFLLGDTHADLGEPGEAIRAYQQYLNLGGSERGEIRAKIDRLSRDMLAREVRASIADESEAVPADSTVAVAPFLDVAGEEEFASLSQGLAAVLITDLRKVHGFRVLERERLGVLLEELARSEADGAARGDGVGALESGDEAERDAALEAKRGATRESGAEAALESGDEVERDAALEATRGASLEPGAEAALEAESGASLEAELVSLRDAPPPVDAHTAPQWGRILRVQNFVQGFFSRLGDDRLLIGADVVSIQGVAKSAGAPLDGPLRDVLYLEKGLARRVLAALGAAPTEAEERELDELLTGSPEAFLAYSRGLRFLDQGLRAEARAAFHEALIADPAFVEAAEAEALAAASEESFDELRAKVWDVLTPEGAEPAVDLGLIDVAVRVSGGPAPDGTGPEREREPVSVLAPSGPDRIVVRTIPSLPPPPGTGGTP